MKLVTLLLLVCATCSAELAAEDSWEEAPLAQVAPKIHFVRPILADRTAALIPDFSLLQAGAQDSKGDCSGPLVVVFADLTADGACHAKCEGIPGFGSAILHYKLSCAPDGSLNLISNKVLVEQGSPCAALGRLLKTDSCAADSPVSIPSPSCVDLGWDSAGQQGSCTNGSATFNVFAAPPTPLNVTAGYVTMRDEAPLYTQNVYPSTVDFNSAAADSEAFASPVNGDQKIASVLVQCPYDTAGSFAQGLMGLPGQINGVVGALGLKYNAAMTLVQSRGLYLSGPPTQSVPPNEFDSARYTKKDSGDVAQWVLNQTWSNGVIMTQGVSAMGMMALLAASKESNIATSAAWYSITTNDLKEPWYRQGAVQIGILNGILNEGYLPPSEAYRILPDLAQNENDDPNDPFWAPLKMEDWSRVNWPTVVRTSWYDMFQKGGLRSAANIQKHARCFGLFKCTHTLIVDALGHAGLGGVAESGSNGNVFPYNKTANDLLGALEPALAAVMLYTFQHATNNIIAAGLSVFYAGLMALVPDKIVHVMGSAGNYISAFSEWPEVTHRQIYLGDNNALSWDSPVSSSGSETYTYDPSDPADTYGGWLFKQAINPHYEGCVDQSPLGARGDVLQFNTQPLAEDLALCGPVTAHLTVGSTANDTDFLARLVDQYPSGERYLVAEGVIRMRWRDHGLTPVPMVEGESYPVELDMWNVCWIFAAGHRVGVDITSSSSFMYLPNPNTGGALQERGIWPNGGDVYTGPNITADNSIFYGSSRLTLPVVDKANLPNDYKSIIPTAQEPPSEEQLLQMGTEALIQQNRR
jgi:predicted acyl esterase